jgi:hypothetical protein
MKNMFKSMAVLALASSVSFAGTDAAAPAAAAAPDKDLAKKIQDQGIYVESAKPGVVLSGYVDAGYSFNGDSSANSTSKTVDNVRFGGDTNTRGSFNLNAFKLALEKPLGDKNDFVAGFRADLMYGQDASYFNGVTANSTSGATTQANGGNALFVEQAFVDFRAPVGNGIDFKVGRFVALAGYEVIERPANLNITYGNLFQNAIPLYHQGVQASYKFNDTINIAGAIVNGWNNARPNVPANTPGLPTTASNSDNYGGIFQANVNSAGGNANITNTAYYGINGDTNSLGGTSGANNQPNFVEDIWGNWKPKFANDKLLLGFNGDYGIQGYDTSFTTSKQEQWYGAALYTKYQFTKIYSLAGRADWIHNTNGDKWSNGSDVGGVFGLNGAVGATGLNNPGQSNDVYSYTLTSSFDIWENMLLRAEYRIDWGNDWGVTPNSSGSGSSWGASHLFTAEVVYSF